MEIPQIVLVKDYLDMEVIGQTTDDAEEALIRPQKSWGYLIRADRWLNKYASGILAWKFSQGKIPDMISVSAD